ncbi:flagellar basal body rod protein FlgB [Paenibacillus sp. FJAT-26967]|uniref:flagellar basal body rod protein FlgB n=1 Tax=Paenibacillus sp. FJAT-26967 TaxID=1729690 RepID=UPI000839160B|nr:flagellar basal body rod protein FlgB [Paenibacillus sp. FJAT-26967]
MLQSSTNRLNEKALDLAAARHQAILSNIANADTPGYKSKYVSFEEELRKATGDTKELEGIRSHKLHFPIPGREDSSLIQTKTTGPFVFNNNENSVDVDSEMSLLAKNQLYYSFYADRVSGHYKKMNGILKNLT